MSSAVMYLDGAVVFTSCRGQKSVSLSSCESELYAAVSAACDLLYVAQCLETLLGKRPDLSVRLDNATARQLCFRQGSSQKTRHIDARMFWVQEKTRDKVLSFLPVAGLVNPGDIGTKVLPQQRLQALSGAQNVVDARNGFEHVGKLEWMNLLEQVAIQRQVRRVTKAMIGRVKTNSAFLRVAMLSLLVTGAEASMRYADAGSQTETVRSMWMNMCIVVSVFIALSLEPLRAKLFGHSFDHAAGNSTPNGTESNETNNESDIPRNVSVGGQDVMWVAHDMLVIDF